MGALRGSISFAKFYVRGELADDFRDAFVDRIRLGAFAPLTLEADAEESAGWVSVESPLDAELDHGKVFYNSYLNLGLRVDRWQIPSALFKAHFAEAERDLLEKKGRQRLGRREKEELRAVVSRRLRAEILPTMKVVDLSWNLETGVVRFWSGSAKLQEVLEALFEKTFGLDLVPESPYTAAAELGMTDAETHVFAALTPTAFHASSPQGAAR